MVHRSFVGVLVLVSLSIAVPGGVYASSSKVSTRPCANLLLGYGSFASRERAPVEFNDNGPVRVVTPADRYEEVISLTVETAQPSCTGDGAYYTILVQDERNTNRYLSDHEVGNAERIDGRAGQGYVHFEFDVFEDTDSTPCVHIEAHDQWKGYAGVVVDRLPDTGCFEMTANSASETVVSD